MSVPVKRCGKCGRQKPVTDQYWYFHKSGALMGTTTGYCKHCQRVYLRSHEERLSPEKLAKRRLQQRDWIRRKEASNPSRYRVSKYDAYDEQPKGECG